MIGMSENEEVKMARRYSPKFKFHVVLEMLVGGKTNAQVAKAYGVHPNSISTWRQALLEKGPEICGVKAALEAVDLPKPTWCYHQEHKVTYEEKYALLLPVLQTIAGEHWAYGRPRITVELRETHGCHVNHKVVQRLLRWVRFRLSEFGWVGTF
jgi:transposase-like protein